MSEIHRIDQYPTLTELLEHLDAEHGWLELDEEQHETRS